MTGPQPTPAQRLTIPVSPGIDLEAQWDVSADPSVVVVFCHPHPLHRGAMNVPLMEKVSAVLVERGLAVLRFNFRGVRRSTGRWSDGVGEIDDVAAAVETAAEAYPDVPLAVAGWSFGGAASLHWHAREASSIPWAGIAPPVRRDGTDRLPAADLLTPAPRTFIIGDRDQFATVDEVEGYAASVGGTVHVLKGSDHFFYFREDRVGGLVADALGAVVESGR